MVSQEIKKDGYCEIDLAENSFAEALVKIRTKGVFNIILKKIREKVSCAIDPYESDPSLWEIDQADIKDIIFSKERISFQGVEKELLAGDVKKIILSEGGVLRVVFKDESGKSILGIKFNEPRFTGDNEEGLEYHKEEDSLRNILKEVLASNFPEAEMEYPKSWGRFILPSTRIFLDLCLLVN